MNGTPTVLVLGGYGNFGRRIVAALDADRNYRIVIAGRDAAQGHALARELDSNIEVLSLDCRSPNLASEIEHLQATLVIHTAGPFQSQDYSVARSSIDAGAHYLDLADARAYVCGIQCLDERARLKDSLVVSGASSLPALSCAVVDRLR
jgi:short subunit dehydrogenase-like uncharacterized protein